MPLKLTVVLALSLITLSACQSPVEVQSKPAQSVVPAPEQGSASSPATRTISPATFSGGDGASRESAVVIIASNEFVGVRAEYAWLREHFPGYKRTSQALQRQAGKSYDVLEIQSPTGSKQTVYFDISGFYGKL